MSSKVLIAGSKAGNFQNIGLAVLATQLREEMHWHFPITGNGVFRALNCVPLCRLYFWSDCNEISEAFETQNDELENIFGNILFAWIPYN